MKKILAIVLVIVLANNCGIRKTAKITKTPAEKNQGIINEKFDPLILNDEDIKIKKSEPVEAESDFNDSFIKYMGKKENFEEEVQGYRVQICAVSDEEAARNIERDAILKFNEKVYLIYDSPYYKVRIGDCTTRFEADRLQQIAISKGFDDAWVVKTKVKPKPEFENEPFPPPDENK